MLGRWWWNFRAAIKDFFRYRAFQKRTNPYPGVYRNGSYIGTARKVKPRKDTNGFPN